MARKKTQKTEDNPLGLGTITLTLKYRWYDMIASGEKKTEYRELKEYWCKRIKGLGIVCPYTLPYKEGRKFCQKYGKECLSGCTITQKDILFTRGRNYSETMKVNLETLSVAEGKPEWGAPEGVKVICLGLGERTDNKNA